VVEEVEAVFEDLLIEWVALAPSSPGVDRSIAALAIRRTTGVTIIAITRGAQAITAPQPSEVLRAGDRLVVVSRPQDLREGTGEVQVPGPPPASRSPLRWDRRRPTG